MPIKQLVAVIAPPKTPLDDKGHWWAAETVVGVKYPADFRDIITRYGSGEFFQGHLRVYNPLTLEGLAFIKRDEGHLHLFREEIPLPIHPDSPGLLPWGGDENGNRYCWLAKSKDEKWPVVYLGHGSWEYPRVFRMGITTFLARYATDQLKELARADDPITKEMRVFTPGRTQSEVARELIKSRKKD